jgi:hypothetical protein
MNFHLFQSVDQASTATAFGSGKAEMKIGSFAQFRVANRSISGTPKVLHRRQKESRSRFHSLEIGNVLDRASASVFRAPGM